MPNVPMTYVELWPPPLSRRGLSLTMAGTTRATTPGEPPLLQPLLMVTRCCIYLELISFQSKNNSLFSCQYFFPGGLFPSLCFACCTWPHSGDNLSLFSSSQKLNEMPFRPSECTFRWGLTFRPPGCGISSSPCMRSSIPSINPFPQSFCQEI